jgi:hypothetical protein
LWFQDYGVETRYLAIASEARADKEGSVPATVNCTVIELAIAPELLVVTSFKTTALRAVT